MGFHDGLACGRAIIDQKSVSFDRLFQQHVRNIGQKWACTGPGVPGVLGPVSVRSSEKSAQACFSDKWLSVCSFFVLSALPLDDNILPTKHKLLAHALRGVARYLPSDVFVREHNVYDSVMLQCFRIEEKTYCERLQIA